MLLFITTRGHSYTARDLVQRKIGWDIPVCTGTSYDALFQSSWHLQSSWTRRAVHIFTDLERLSDWELLLAADLYRRFREAGLVCLNNPARVMTRYQLLVNLQRAGINPFGVYRAESLPKPEHFPVFVRSESDHSEPLSDLLNDQESLDRCLKALCVGGRPLKGLIVTEYAAEPIAPGVWRKFGTFRVGANFSVHNALVSDRWAVKTTKAEIITEEMYEAERAVVASNSFAEAVRPAFDIAGVEWGRADHALYQGSQVIYEINTNPTVHFEPQESPIRAETKKISSKRMAQLLGEIDAGDGAAVRFRPLTRKRP